MKNKYVAFFLALFLGWLGFHKFYLGKWGQGLLYILFMISFIPLFISIFEAFTYLLNKKERFDINFNAEYLRNKEIYDRQTRKLTDWEKTGMSEAERRTKRMAEMTSKK